jgi:hypothetical protein
MGDLDECILSESSGFDGIRWVGTSISSAQHESCQQVHSYSALTDFVQLTRHVFGSLQCVQHAKIIRSHVEVAIGKVLFNYVGKQRGDG